VWFKKSIRLKIVTNSHNPGERTTHTAAISIQRQVETVTPLGTARHIATGGSKQYGLRRPSHPFAEANVGINPAC